MEALFKKILIAIDNSTHSMKAARIGFSLAHQVNGSVAVLCVVDKSKEVVNADLGITPRQSEALLRKQADDTIEQYIRLFDGINRVERFMPEGVPEREIIAIAAEWQADLIVMGTHGRSAIGQMLTGSVAEYVIRHSTVPVLITPPRMP